MTRRPKKQNNGTLKPITYFITRDSDNDVLSSTCDLWTMKPLRVRQGSRVVWVAKSVVAGHLGAHSTEVILKQFRTKPDTNRELIIVNTYTRDE